MLAELNHVEKHYKGFSLDCSLKVQEGCVTGLIGANGAGKSTTFKALLDLIKTDAGEVKVFGKCPKDLRAEDKEDLGIVLPESSFSSYLNVKQITGIMDKLYTRFDRQKFTEQCSRFSLPMDKKIKDFSTGMKAKLKVLIAMSHQAKLLILDEPTAGLDVIARDEILDMLREYMEEDGRAIFISSHISTDLEGLCDDLYMIDRGKIVLHEDTDVLMDQYGILKVDDTCYRSLDKKYIIRVKKESFGYSCLTNEKSYYLENYPSIVIEKSSVDDVISMVVKGEVL
ncbi:MAG: ABC transporter ATP-binding protein [Eubacteriales bacterium]|nr:ABC transporter ATP-binding protein [Eubacteriales bacterium]